MALSILEPNISESAQPPITNRGAQMTIPPENRSLIDWVGFTLKISNPKDIVILLGLV